MRTNTGGSPQKTITRPFSFEGVGLHTGKNCRVEVFPSPADTGIRFFRSDLKIEIPLTPEAVTSTARGTTLSVGNKATIHTIEHFLATIHGWGINNLKVEMDSEEMPILDGSAAPFFDLFKKAGVVEQDKIIYPLKVTEPFELRFGRDVYLRAEPLEGPFELDVTTSFSLSWIFESQNNLFRLSEKNFERELASARTFCFEDEVEELRRQGLIKGGDLDCALVIGKKGVLNGPFRFENEIVRHKTLDLLGDLMLLNRPLWAKITVRKAGHRYHVELAKAILKKFGEGSKSSKIASKEGTMLDILLKFKNPSAPISLPAGGPDFLELEPNKRVVGIKKHFGQRTFFSGSFSWASYYAGCFGH